MNPNVGNPFRLCTNTWVGRAEGVYYNIRRAKTQINNSKRGNQRVESPPMDEWNVSYCMRLVVHPSVCKDISANRLTFSKGLDVVRPALKTATKAARKVGRATTIQMVDNHRNQGIANINKAKPCWIGARTHTAQLHKVKMIYSPVCFIIFFLIEFLFWLHFHTRNFAG